MGQLPGPGLARVAALPPHSGHCSLRLLPPGTGCSLLLPAYAFSSSGPSAAKGAVAWGCECSWGAWLLIPAGCGASARAGLAVAGRCPSHQRWRGAEGRAEQAQWVGSLLRVAMAASTTRRAPLAQGGAAQSGRRPRAQPRTQAESQQPCAHTGFAASEACEGEVKALAPLPGPGTAPLPGKLEHRAVRAAGTVGERQPPPAFRPWSCAPVRPAPLRQGGRCA